jgi:Flp pilus assembly protein TadG
MAIVLPVFMMVVMGIIEFGRGMMVGQLVTNAARYGARLAAVDGSTNASVESDVEDFLVEAVGIAAADATVTITVTAAPGNPDPTNDLMKAQPKDLVKVHVQIPYDKVGYVGGKWLSGTQLTGQCTMRHE